MSLQDLSLPMDVPWKLVATSSDMLATRANPFPHAAWKPSLAIFAYAPDLSDLPEVFSDRTLTFLKVTCSITSYTPPRPPIPEKPLPPPKTQEGEFAYVLPSDQKAYDQALQAYQDAQAKVQKFSTASYPCSGALVQVAIYPKKGDINKTDISKLAVFTAFEPQKRELIEVATESGESLTQSKSEVNTRKGITTTDSTEDLDVFTGANLNVSAGGVGVGAGVQGQWGTIKKSGTEHSDTTTTDSSRESRESASHSTSLSQLYHQLNSYHLGTNRAIFFLQPRPHTLQQKDQFTFIDGPQEIEGVQEFFLVVSHPKGTLLQGGFLFNIDPGFAAELNNNIASVKLRDQFQRNSITLSTQVKVTVNQGGSGWTITDGNTYYDVRSENQTLNVYNETDYSVDSLLNDYCIDALLYTAHLDSNATRNAILEPKTIETPWFELWAGAKKPQPSADNSFWDVLGTIFTAGIDPLLATAMTIEQGVGDNAKTTTLADLYNLDPPGPFLFTLGQDFIGDLNKGGHVSANLMQSFNSNLNGQTITSQAQVNVIQPQGSSWSITDGGTTYNIQLRHQTLIVYGDIKQPNPPPFTNVTPNPVKVFSRVFSLDPSVANNLVNDPNLGSVLGQVLGGGWRFDRTRGLGGYDLWEDPDNKTFPPVDNLDGLLSKAKPQAFIDILPIGNPDNLDSYRPDGQLRIQAYIYPGDKTAMYHALIKLYLIRDDLPSDSRTVDMFVLPRGVSTCFDSMVFDLQPDQAITNTPYQRLEMFTPTFITPANVAPWKTPPTSEALPSLQSSQPTTDINSQVPQMQTGPISGARPSGMDSYSIGAARAKMANEMIPQVREMLIAKLAELEGEANLKNHLVSIYQTDAFFRQVAPIMLKAEIQQLANNIAPHNKLAGYVAIHPAGMVLGAAAKMAMPFLKNAAQMQSITKLSASSKFPVLTLAHKTLKPIDRSRLVKAGVISGLDLLNVPVNELATRLGTTASKAGQIRLQALGFK